jgi:DNA-binding NarL/FixJ family response regulator
MNEGDVNRAIDALERIGMVLGALFSSHLGDTEQKVKAERLSRCGFSNQQIADILGTTAGTVGVALHHARKRKNRSTSRKKKQKGKKK